MDALKFVFISPPAGPSTSLQPDNGPPPCSSTPGTATAWQPPPSDSPQPSPRVSPDPQPAERPAQPPPSDARPEEKAAPSPTAPVCRPQGSSAGGEQEATEEAKSGKKQQLHCPTCKVTVNSSSQLEAHCSGVYDSTRAALPLKVPYYGEVTFPTAPPAH